MIRYFTSFYIAIKKKTKKKGVYKIARKKTLTCLRIEWPRKRGARNKGKDFISFTVKLSITKLEAILADMRGWWGTRASERASERGGTDKWFLPSDMIRYLRIT